MRPPSPLANRRLAPSASGITIAVALAATWLVASGQTPGGSADPFGLQPRRPPNAPSGQRLPSPPPAPAASPVIAQVGTRGITQADFERVAQPYYRTLRAQLGEGYTPDVQRLAAFNVLDELVRREVLVLEAERQRIDVTQTEIDAILRQDPFFLTDGKFDPVKLASYKTSPGTNYQSVLPRIREVAAITKLDESVRRRLTPTPAQTRAEWDRRSAQIRFKVLPLLTRDMALEPEAPESAWAEYYRAHPDQFMRKTRVRLRYLRLPLPAEADSTRATEETRALERGKAIADSLRAGTLADTVAGFTDTGPFEIPTTVLPGLGRVPGLTDSISRAETDSSVRVVGPHVGRSAVIVGVVSDRQPKAVPPLMEVLGDVKRRADAEHRRVATEAGQRAHYHAHLERWRGTSVSLTWIVLDPATVIVKPPLPAEIDAWYAQHGRTLFDLPDSSRAWMPPPGDSLRAVAGTRLTDARRQQRVSEAMARIVQGLATTRDARALARANGAAAETLSIAPYSGAEGVFGKGFVDTLLATAASRKGKVEGPRRFRAGWAAWRIDGVDTSFVSPYEAVRARSDQAYAEQRRVEEETDGLRYFEAHRDDFLSPMRFALDYVVVPIPPADSVRIPEAELRLRYAANRSSYSQEEQVRTRHILFMTREAGADVEARAKARADSVLAVIRREGGDFAELAKRISEEPGAPTSGGDLGWFGRGRMVKEFELAAFALRPDEISPVVKTQFGYHIIKLEERRAAGTRPFDEVRGELRTQMAQARGDSTARRIATALRRRLALGGDTKALTAPHGGVVSAPPIVATEPVPIIGVVPDLPRDLPGLTPGRWATQAYRAGSAFLVLRVRERIPPGPAGFDEVKLRVMDDMRNAKRRAALGLRVEAVRAALAAGATLDSLAAPYGGLKDSGLRTRSTAFVPVIGTEPRVVERAFSMREGDVTDTLQVANGVVWLRLEERPAADTASLLAGLPQIERELTKQRYDAWLESRKRAVRIEILRADLEGPRSAPPKTP